MAFLKKKKSKLGIALGSGAAKGLSHIGILLALEEKGISPDYVCGSSMGALVGAIYCSGLPMKDFADLITSLNRREMLGLFTPTFSKSGLVNGDNIEKFLFYLLGDRTFSDLERPFTVVATDVFTGEEVVISKGPLIKAVRASISIPGIFIPVKMDGRSLIDGGITDPVPVSVIKAMGADISIGVKITTEVKKIVNQVKVSETKGRKILVDYGKIRDKVMTFLDKMPKDEVKVKLKDIIDITIENKKEGEKESLNMFDVILNSVYIMQDTIALLRLKQDKPDFVITPDISNISPMGYLRSKEIIKIGCDSAEAVLPEIEKRLKG